MSGRLKQARSSLDIVADLSAIHARLAGCRDCPDMCGTPVSGPAIAAPVMVFGQAPGIHEASRGKPFAHTAGKTLFRWFESATGMDEGEVRRRFYFSATARCFPGKAKSGSGDREPSHFEIERCRRHVGDEVRALEPDIIIAVGRIAIAESLGAEWFPKGTPLHEAVGSLFDVEFHGVPVKVIPLPHPSGVSRWPHTELGKARLAQALDLLRESIGMPNVR